MLALDREAYNTFVNKRTAYIQRWEETQSEKGDMRRYQRTELSTLTTCDICLKTCRTMGGLKAHFRKMHKQRRAEEHICGRCHRILKNRKSAMINHEKVCLKKNDPKTVYPAKKPSEEKKPCNLCSMTSNKNNRTRHRNRVEERNADVVEANPVRDR